jgi:hypothetical protein
MLSEEFVRNVGVAKCCAMNCCQHFPHEKTLLLKQNFWSLSFEDHRAYGLDIPRRLLQMESEVDKKLSLFKV